MSISQILDGVEKQKIELGTTTTSRDFLCVIIRTEVLITSI